MLLRRLESNSQFISGVGFPDAIHFKCKDTPGCIVLSLKYSLIWGGSTVIILKLKLEIRKIIRKCTRTSSSQFEFGASLGALLFVPHEALIHPFVFFPYGIDSQHPAIVRIQPFSILQPRNRLYRIPFIVASQSGGSSKIYSLNRWFDNCIQRS